MLPSENPCLVISPPGKIHLDLVTCLCFDGWCFQCVGILDLGWLWRNSWYFGGVSKFPGEFCPGAIETKRNLPEKSTVGLRLVSLRRDEMGADKVYVVQGLRASPHQADGSTVN